MGINRAPQVNRWITLVLGTFLTTAGITLSVRADLGVLALSTPSYTISRITGLNLGLVQFFYYTSLVLLQIPILGKRSQTRNLLQIPFALLMSVFITLTGRLFAFIHFESYPLNMAVLLLGICSTAFGVFLLLEANLVINAPEGLAKAVSVASSLSVSTAKILVDIALVVLAACLGLLFLHRIVGIREGTLLSAVLIGKLVGMIPKPIKHRVHRFCNGQDEAAPPAQV